MSKCRLVSLDTSTSCTGYGVYENGVLVSHGTITLSSGEKKSELPNHILMYEKIESFLKEKKPHIVAVELTCKPNNASTQRKLDRILGDIELYCIRKKIFYYEMNPVSWRKAIRDNVLPLKLEKGKPNRPQWKKWSMKAVEKFGIKATDDETDAILIGLAYILTFGDRVIVRKILGGMIMDSGKK